MHRSHKRMMTAAAALLSLGLAPALIQPASAATTGYWRGEVDTDAGSGLNTPNDVAGNAFTATAATIDTDPADLPFSRVPRTGAFDTGTINGSANINGTVTAYAALDSGSFTFETMARTGEGTYTLASRTDGSTSGFDISATTGTLNVTYYVDNGAGGSEVHTVALGNLNNNWSHVAFTYDAATGTASTYINGRLQHATTSTAGRALVWTGAGDLKIGTDMDGGGAYSANAKGIMDEVRTSDTALASYQFLAAPAVAVDFGDVNQSVQAYHKAFAEGSGGDINFTGPATMSYDTPVANGGNLTVTIATDNSATHSLDFRDRGAVTYTDPDLGSIGSLLQDQVKNQNGDLILTLTGLAAGQYEMTSWHHDQSGGATNNILNILVSDAVGLGRDVADGLVVSGGSTPALATHATYSIFSNGVDPITITFHNADTNGDLETPLNGFQIQAIPAPAALPAGLALLGLAGLRRRRRIS